MTNIYRKSPLAKFIRYEAKGLARKLAGMWADTIPEPTKENLRHKNSHTLLDIRDEFLSKDLAVEDDKLFRGFFNQLIVVYDFDIFWRERFDRFVKLVKETDWELFEGKEEPRYQWWLEKRDAPPDTNLVLMLRMERWYAHQRRDGLAMARLKVMQNIAEGLSEGKDVDPVLFTENYGKIAFRDKSWEVGSEKA